MARNIRLVWKFASILRLNRAFKIAGTRSSLFLILNCYFIEIHICISVLCWTISLNNKLKWIEIINENFRSVKYFFLFQNGKDMFCRHLAETFRKLIYVLFDRRLRVVSTNESQHKKKYCVILVNKLFFFYQLN